MNGGTTVAFSMVLPARTVYHHLSKFTIFRKNSVTVEKLILLSEDVAAAKRLIATLHDIDVSKEYVTVVANKHTPLDELPDADLHGSDVVPAYKRGMAIGGTAGLLAGMVALSVAPAGIVIAGAAAAAGVLGGASFGAFAAALIGVNVPNSQLDEYEDAVKQGKVIVIAEIDEERLDEVKTEIRAKHDNVDIKGTMDLLPPAV